MYSRYAFHTISICTLLFVSMSINAAILFVTNLDDGTPGSLRATIAAASGGDTIRFSVAGTILLDEMLGELVVDKQLTIDGQDKIAVDGQNQINIGFHITGASASNSIIQNITIQNFNGHEVDPGSGTAPQELPAYGIFIDNNAANCSAINATIKNIHSGGSQDASGINSNEIMKDVTRNQIQNISSQASTFSGSSRGISISGASGVLTHNTISGIFSGPANNISGSVEGIRTFNIFSGECSNNIIHTLSSGAAGNNSGPVIGMRNNKNNYLNNIIHTLSSGAASNSSGLVIGIDTVNPISGNCSHNAIYNLSTGVANINSGFIRGIVINNANGSCSDNTISHLKGGQAGNDSQAVIGILIENTLEGDCLNNIILYLTSGDAGNISGTVGGIFGDGTFEGNLSNNTIQYLTTGTAGSVDQHAMGIFINRIEGNCINNLVTDISITDAIAIERAGGIRFSFVNDGGLLACNTIRRITGGEGGRTFGMEVEEGNNLTIRNNTIDSIENINGPAYGMYLGSTIENTFFTNSLVFANTISNITGSSLTGFGISLFGDGSTGNDLLSNSIFTINGKAIDIIDNGVPVDATVTLQSAVCGAQTIFVRGTLEPDAPFEESEFLLQFFSSNQNSPPQTMTFIGEATVQADDTTPFVAEIKSCKPTDSDEYITATATALPPGTEQNNNTSEVSNAISGCNNQTICNLATTTCNLEPAPCPILIRQ